MKARDLTSQHVITKYGDLEPITFVERDAEIRDTQGRVIGRVEVRVVTNKGDYGYDLDEDVPTLQD